MLKRLIVMSVSFVLLLAPYGGTIAQAGPTPQVAPEAQKETDAFHNLITGEDKTKLSVQNYMPFAENGVFFHQKYKMDVKVDGSAPSDVVVKPEGSKISFEFDLNDYKTRTKIESSPAAYTDFKYKIFPVMAYPWDESKEVFKGEEITGTYKQDCPIDYPTDPYSVKVSFVLLIEFKDVPTLGAPARELWCYAMESLQIKTLDTRPPDGINFSQPALFATTGHKMSEFNAKAALWKFKHPNGAPTQNPDKLEIFVKDNSYFNTLSVTDPNKKGTNYGKSSVDMAIFVEKFQTFYQEVPPETAGLKKLERTLGEAVKPGMVPAHTPDGEFGWVGPIWMKDLQEKHGWTCSIKPAESHRISDSEPDRITELEVENGVVKNKRQACSIFVFSGPLAGIEKEVERLENDPDASMINPHFASLANMGFKDAASYQEHSLNDDSAGFKDERMMRICAAVSDASGNVTVPPLGNKVTDQHATLKFFQDKFGAGNLGQSLVCPVILPVIAYDDIPPTPVLSMTNTETNKTTIFTIPNSDCVESENAKTTKKPYIPYNDLTPEIAADVWHFNYKGDSPIMKWLKVNDPARYDEYLAALTISEDVRLIFDMTAYDNINKYLHIEATDGQKAGQYGISTPMAGMNSGGDESVMRYETWSIKDDGAPDSLKFEDAAKKLFVYPDYIFRKPEPGKTYSVSFFVEDFSPFFDSRGSYVDPQPAKRHGNIRQVILEFKIEGRTVRSQSMGGNTKTTTVLEDQKQGGNK